MSMDHPSSWFHPRRRLYAGRLVEYIQWHGGKVYLTPAKYADIQDRTRLDRYAVEQAADDLCRLRNIDIHMAGETCVLTLLSADLDRAAHAPTDVLPGTPQFALVAARKREQR